MNLPLLVRHAGVSLGVVVRGIDSLFLFLALLLEILFLLLGSHLVNIRLFFIDIVPAVGERKVGAGLEKAPNGAVPPGELVLQTEERHGILDATPSDRRRLRTVGRGVIHMKPATLDPVVVRRLRHISG